MDNANAAGYEIGMSQRQKVRFLDRTTPPHIVTLVLIAGLPAAAMNIYLPSLPNMTAFFDTDYRMMQLSVSLYLAVNAVLQLFIGPVSDRFGRRPVVLASFVLFGFATIGTLFAPTAEIFLLFRMAQAVVVAGMVLSRAIVRDIYPENESASMIGYVTMGMALVPMISPVVGGMLDQLFGWKANFTLLLAMAAVVSVLAWRDLGETAQPSTAGFAEQMRQTPELFSSPRFWGYNVTIMTASGSFFAYLGGAPFVGSVIFHLSPARLGLFFGIPAIGYLVGNALSGKFSVRYGINWMVAWGTRMVSFGLGMALVLFYLGFENVYIFFSFMIFVGLGNGMVLPNATAGMLSVRPKLAGTAAGVGGALMIGGGAALSALAGALLTPGSGAYPLLWTMFITSCLSVAAIQFVIGREKRLGLS